VVRISSNVEVADSAFLLRTFVMEMWTAETTPMKETVDTVRSVLFLSSLMQQTKLETTSDQVTAYGLQAVVLRFKSNIWTWEF